MEEEKEKVETSQTRMLKAKMMIALEVRLRVHSVVARLSHVFMWETWWPGIFGEDLASVMAIDEDLDEKLRTLEECKESQIIVQTISDIDIDLAEGLPDIQRTQTWKYYDIPTNCSRPLMHMPFLVWLHHGELARIRQGLPMLHCREKSGIQKGPTEDQFRVCKLPCREMEYHNIPVPMKKE